MAVVKNLMIRAGADFSAMRKEMSKAQKNLSDFKSSVSRTMKGIGVVLATLGIGAAIKDAAKEAMGFEASLQQINRMLGTSSGAFQQWANDNAAAFGMSRSEAVKFGAVYANLISGFSRDTTETFQRTQALLKASAIVASSTGRTMQDTLERIRSGLLGNTEAIEDLGINVNVAMIESTDTFKKFANGKHWEQLDFRTQQQIRLFAILEQATKKYGTEIAQNTASRQAKFVAQLKNAQLALGQAFLPIYNTILPALTRMATALANVAAFIRDFSEALFGTQKAQQQAKATTAQAGAVSGLGDAYEKAGKQAQKSVAGFDKVNLVGGTSGAAAVDAGSAISTGDTTAQGTGLSKVAEKMKEVSTKAKEMAAKVKAAFGDMSDFITTHKDIIISALAALAAGFAAFFAATKWGAIVAALTNGAKWIVTALETIGAFIAAVTIEVWIIVAAIAALVGAFVYFYRTNETFRGVVDGILKAIGDAAKWLWQNVMVPFGKWLAEVMPKAWGAVTNAASWLWKNVLVPFGNFMVWMWHNVFVPIGNVLKDILGVAFQFVADVAKSFWKNVLVPLGNALSEMFGPAVEAASAVLTFLWEDVMKPLGSFLAGTFKGQFEDLTKAIEYLWKNVLKPVATYLSGAFKNVIDDVFKTIGDVIGDMKTAFIGLMTFITGVFTGDWKTAWEGVKKIFKGVFDGLYDIIKFPLNQIIDAVNTLIRGLNKIHFDLPDWIPGIGGKEFGISIPRIPKLEVGTNYVARDGLAFLHEGEAVVPKEYNPVAGGGDNKEVVSVLRAILQAIKQSGNGDTLSLNKTALGRATTSAINDIARRTGVNPINV